MIRLPLILLSLIIGSLSVSFLTTTKTLAWSGKLPVCQNDIPATWRDTVTAALPAFAHENTSYIWSQITQGQDQTTYIWIRTTNNHNFIHNGYEFSYDTSNTHYASFDMNGNFNGVTEYSSTYPSIQCITEVKNVTYATSYTNAGGTPYPAYQAPVTPEPEPEPEPEPTPDPVATGFTFQQKVGVMLAGLAGMYFIHMARYRGND